MLKVWLFCLICLLPLIQPFYLSVRHLPSSRSAVVWGFLELQFIERDNKTSLLLEQAAVQQGAQQTVYLEEVDFIKPFADRKYRFYPELMQSIEIENHEHHMLKLAYTSKSSADWEVVLAFSNSEHIKVEDIRQFIENHQFLPHSPLQLDEDWSEEESQMEEDL